MANKQNLSEGDKKLINDINEYGLHVIKVMEDESGPAFTYSVGLYHSYKHPEVIIIGLKQELSHSIINEIGERVKNGESFVVGKFYSGFIEGFDCCFLNIREKFYREYVGYGLWFYEHSDFPLLQCIYPTIKGIYPWQKEWPESIRYIQPVIGELK